MKIIGICLVFLICLFVSSSLNAQIYSWTDENGVKHYSNIPPTRKVEEIEVSQEVESDDSEDGKQTLIEPKKGRTNPARRERVGCPFESQMGRHEESTKTE
ncbi:MAG: DUF4124 domain-containing protein [Deltaproteobacteria bacterium]|nr:DUF4124 domain-containing protein [Deltaproteobacteria bacterium]